MANQYTKKKVTDAKMEGELRKVDAIHLRVTITRPDGREDMHDFILPKLEPGASIKTETCPVWLENQVVK